MTEFNCDTRSHGNFLYGRNNLCLLFYKDCIIIVIIELNEFTAHEQKVNFYLKGFIGWISGI